MTGRERAVRGVALLTCAALLAAPLASHIDDFDAQVYLVVARNLARDHAWLTPRYLPSFHPVFRQHLPFGLWPAVAAIRVAGEWAVPVVYGLLMLGAIAAAGRMARSCGGPRAEIAAILLLGTCESIWRYGARPVLDPPLLLTATAAAAAALEGRWTLAAVLGAAAALVKGPFGLVPLAGAFAGRLPDRRGLWTFAAAVVPFAAFIAIDPGGGWRKGYFDDQLLASATAAWHGSVQAWWFPISVIGRRFWPGLPFALLGFVRAPSDRPLRPLAIAAAVSAALLVLPARKWGNHAYVIFPLWAALAGSALAASVPRLRTDWVAGACAVAAAVFSLSGVVRRLSPPPCDVSTALREPLSSLPAQAKVLVVARRWDPMAQLAAERDLLPEIVAAVPAKTNARDAIVDRGMPVTPPWEVVATGKDYSLLRTP